MAFDLASDGAPSRRFGASAELRTERQRRARCKKALRWKTRATHRPAAKAGASAQRPNERRRPPQPSQRIFSSRGTPLASNSHSSRIRQIRRGGSARSACGRLRPSLRTRAGSLSHRRRMRVNARRFPRSPSCEVFSSTQIVATLQAENFGKCFHRWDLQCAAAPLPARAPPGESVRRRFRHPI